MMALPRIGALGLLLLILAGCGPATTGPVRPGDETVGADRPALALLEQLPGRYSETRLAGVERNLLSLSVRPEPSVDQLQPRLRITQRQTGQPDRDFLLTFLVDQPSSALGEIAAEFAPVGADGQVRARCPMRFAARREGLSGQTDPANCNFGGTALLKEIAFDGATLVIADRVMSWPEAEPVADDQVHEFRPVRRYSGWAGVRDGDDWRVATAIELESDLEPLEPVDAGGMGLDFEVRLGHYRSAPGSDPILRMEVTDAESGRLVGYAWADPEATSLGFANHQIQIGLTARP